MYFTQQAQTPIPDGDCDVFLIKFDFSCRLWVSLRLHRAGKYISTVSPQFLTVSCKRFVFGVFFAMNLPRLSLISSEVNWNSARSVRLAG